ncbi:MAG: hypothetical protein ACTHKU_11645, partial [Verrucomicrobiota bacterium]
LPITLLSPQNSGGNFEFQFLSQAGFTHTILSRTNLTLGNWMTNSTISGDGSLKLISIPKTNSQLYFRVSTQ